MWSQRTAIPTPPPPLDLLGGVLDRAGPVERRRLAAHAAAGDEDGRAPLAQHLGDRLASAAARPRHERDLVVQLTHRPSVPT
jgi:hypothetical protein